MEAPSSKAAKVAAISDEDLLNFFNNTVVGAHKCEICSNNDWILLSEDAEGIKGNIVVSAHVASGAVFLGDYMPVIMYSCITCGNMKMLNRGFVLSWLRDNKGQ